MDWDKWANMETDNASKSYMGTRTLPHCCRRECVDAVSAVVQRANPGCHSMRNLSSPKSGRLPDSDRGRMVPKSLQALGAATGKIHKSRQYLHPKIFVRHLDSQYRRSNEEHCHFSHTNTINRHSIDRSTLDSNPINDGTNLTGTGYSVSTYFCSSGECFDCGPH